MKSEQQYIDLYHQCRSMIDVHAAPVLNAAREKAFTDFVKSGFPARKLEKYKYTDIGKLFEPNYGLNLAQIPAKVNPYDVFSGDVPNMSTSPYFIVNDTFHTPSATGKNHLPEGVLVGSLREIAKKYPELTEKYYGRLADTESDGITAFNTTFVQDGFMVYVPKGISVEKPVQLINLLCAEKEMLANRRILIVLEEQAHAKILTCDHALTNVLFLATQVIEVFVGRGASLDFCELEETHRQNRRLSHLYVEQEAGSCVLINGITLTGGVTRNTTHVRLAGERAELSLYGMAIEDGEQIVDNNTFVDHAAPHCVSNQLYKYVLDEKAVGAYAGLVLVEKGAHHTSSKQTNRSLCATRETRMYAQPQLEIYNDDVKCSHGATVGQLDENALFYMRQRGISLQEARLLLMFAFVGEVVGNIRIDGLKERLHQLVELRFRGELNKGCEGCDICRKV